MDDDIQEEQKTKFLTGTLQNLLHKLSYNFFQSSESMLATFDKYFGHNLCSLLNNFQILRFNISNVFDTKKSPFKKIN